MQANAGQGEAVPAEQYLNPAFKFDEEDYEALLREAENLDLVLKGERSNEVRPQGQMAKPLKHRCHPPQYTDLLLPKGERT